MGLKIDDGSEQKETLYRPHELESGVLYQIVKGSYVGEFAVCCLAASLNCTSVVVLNFGDGWMERTKDGFPEDLLFRKVPVGTRLVVT